jgi:hypothetical protein
MYEEEIGLQLMQLYRLLRQVPDSAGKQAIRAQIDSLVRQWESRPQFRPSGRTSLASRAGANGDD